MTMKQKLEPQIDERIGAWSFGVQWILLHIVCGIATVTIATIFFLILMLTNLQFALIGLPVLWDVFSVLLLGSHVVVMFYFMAITQKYLMDLYANISIEGWIRCTLQVGVVSIAWWMIIIAFDSLYVSHFGIVRTVTLGTLLALPPLAMLSISHRFLLRRYLPIEAYSRIEIYAWGNLISACIATSIVITLFPLVILHFVLQAYLMYRVLRFARNEKRKNDFAS